MTATKQDLPETVAAIDLGSNSFHMIVARLETSGTLSVIDRLRENVRLSAGLDSKSIIDESAQNRAFECLESFSQRISALPHNAIRIAGTNTLRIATNAFSFVEKAEKILNHPIEIIAGREEARLIYIGVAHGLATTEGRRLVIDIGGGSTEFIIGEGMQPIRRESLYMGCVSASKRFFDDGVITESNMKAAETDAALTLLPQTMDFKNGTWNEAIGCSGTIKAIGNIVHEQGWCKDGINYQSLIKLRKALIDTQHIDKLKLLGLNDSRKPVIAGGLSVLLSIFKILQIDHMRVSDHSMREGLLYDLVGRITHHDVRDATIEAAMTRWSVDITQAKRISKTVKNLYHSANDQLLIDLEPIQPLIKWAVMLHEIGLQVSHNNYHKHGAYILSHADLQGFSRQEQALLAALVLSHRSKFRIDKFKSLMKPFVKAGKYMCVLLRVAVLLHRGRTDQAVPEIAISINDRDINLVFPDGWLDEHSMTLADLIKEINYLDTAGYRLRFE
ncbi:Exopolyphosphatase [hydrothermal vent metagenome]|uniref:Exopolyphosphatase n=1 Tax=hydrothermal vent metagenome TaxID=652676 RepID=A0A3B0WKZ5_9ZZZZ